MNKVTSSKKTHRRTCKNPSCKSKFSTTDSRKIYCGPDCQAVKHITKKRKSTYEIPKTNHFMVYITKEVQRAGTLHVLDQLVGSVEALEALYKVVRTRLVANVLNGPIISGDGKRTDPFHAGHIAPVKHEFVLGMLCAENLIVLPATLNRTHSNAHINRAGVFIYRNEMSIANTILCTDNDVLERAIAYIGVDTVTDFCRKAKLAPSQRAAALKTLFALVNPDDESHARFIALLADKKATTPELIAAIETIQCRQQFKPLMQGEKLSPSAMLIEELIRHAHYRPELEDYAIICRPFTKKGFRHNTLSAESQVALSKLLHGYLEPEMTDEIDELMYDLRLPVRAAAERSRQVQARNNNRLSGINANIQNGPEPVKLTSWDFAQFEAEFVDPADYCFIPYMLPPLTLNLGKTRSIYESGSTLPNGEVAF